MFTSSCAISTLTVVIVSTGRCSSIHFRGPALHALSEKIQQDFLCRALQQELHVDIEETHCGCQETYGRSLLWNRLHYLQNGMIQSRGELERDSTDLVYGFQKWSSIAPSSGVSPIGLVHEWRYKYMPELTSFGFRTKLRQSSDIVDAEKR